MKRNKRRHVDAMRKASRLAPPEEQESNHLPSPTDTASGAKGYGKNAIVVDTGALKLPETFLDEDREDAAWSHPAPVVIVILCVLLSFIAFIAWLIASTPPAN
ncbi:MAG: hypothetical protein M3R15_05885 [Acidobacteriota bacterium]|nr:hypothetical protein [Acidobacteriota bacterium]